MGHEKGCTRRDPSDVIRIGNTYYIWYTKVYGHAAGYWGTIWYATSTDAGRSWTERGEALGVGDKGTFDSHAVFTPNVIAVDKKYYLFYTGVKPTPTRIDGKFENNSTNDITAIGVARSDSPEGPFQRVSRTPVLQVSAEPEQFDSYRVDDASLLFRNNKIWLYYKGRSRNDGAQGPAHTKMGVAFAEKPEGPYIKYSGAILNDSHEVFIWPQGTGVAALASKSSTLEYAEDGLDFSSHAQHIKVQNRPNAPGGFRSDLTHNGKPEDEMRWGISMVANGTECYLIRFQCNFGLE